MRKNRVCYMLLAVVLILGLLSGCSTVGKQETTTAAPQGTTQAAAQAAAQTTAAEDKKVVLKLGTIHSAEDLATESLDKLVELVKEKTNGSLVIEHYPASQLGDITSQMEAVMMGSQDMYFAAATFMSTYVPDLNITGVFFCFSDEQHFINFLNSPIVKDMEAKFLNERGIRVISQNWRRSPRVMLSRKGQIKGLEDMKGLKVRCPEVKTYLESVKALGGNPTSIAWGETYLALSQGVVDASESPIDMIPGMKFHEAAPHITLTNHVRENDTLAINEKKWQSLSKNQQDALISAAEEISEWYNNSMKERIDKAIETMKSEGAKFYEIDVAPFQEVMKQAAYDMENAGLWKKGLYDEVQNMK